jgi:hypothetical protein
VPDGLGSVTNSLEIFNVTGFSKLRRVFEATGEISDGQPKVTGSAASIGMSHATHRSGDQPTNALSGAFPRKIPLKDEPGPIASAEAKAFHCSVYTAILA